MRWELDTELSLCVTSYGVQGQIISNIKHIHPNRSVLGLEMYLFILTNIAGENEMISDKIKISERSILIGLLAFTAGAVLLTSGSNENSDTNQAQAQGQGVQASSNGNNNSTIRVEAGGGNSTAPLTAFVPQSIKIKAGQSVNWYNPTPVADPHSITFMKNNSLFPPFAAPFAVANSTTFKALMPNPNLEPLIVPNPQGTEPTTTKTVIIDNARAYNPTVIDSTGKNITYLPPDSSYSMDGTEIYVNSGWLWPQGQVPPGAPPLTTFTITFEKAGIYDYVCTVHPWMTGSVEVT
jgi:plastocyanin